MIVFLPTSTSASQAYEAYETISGLFTEVTNDTLELSVTDKIWAIILDFVLKQQSVTL